MINPQPVPRNLLVYDLPWQELMPGIVRRTLWAAPMGSGPPTAREMSMVRYEAGAKVPLHKHVGGDEIVFVIEGVLSDEFGDITAGNVGYRPDGCVHSLHSSSGATTLSYLVGGGEMVSERAENSPRSQVIDVNAMPWQSSEGGRFQLKMAWNDEASDRQFILSKLPPRAALAPDEHIGEELIFQIEGTYADEAGILAPGHMGYRPFGGRHSVSSEHGGVSLVYTWGRSKNI
jgi:anti-sigma factor ChrR (cupin superfamily)